MASLSSAVASWRVLLADDHEVMRQGLQLLIDAEPDMRVIGHADNGVTACQLVESLTPDVVVMDLSMPGGHGIESMPQIRRACPSARVVGLSRHSDPGYVRRMLTAGATGYVVKKSSAAELVQAIRVVARGGTYLDSVVTRLLTQDTVSQDAPGDWTDAALTGRETQVLQRIARGRSNKEIAIELSISTKTVEYHKARSCGKLQLRSRADIVRYAISQRWMEE